MWAIVVGDDRWPEWVPHGAFDLKAVPVQYCRLTALASPFQRAVHLAASIASASRVMVTALPEHRARWEPHTWFVRPSMRFLNEGNAVPRIALAAAISSVADRSPSNVLAIIPARSHVVHEFILREALARMVAKLPEVPEGVASLGMIDMDDSVDEDYLVLQRSSVGPGLNVSGIARRSHRLGGTTPSPPGRSGRLGSYCGLRRGICRAFVEALAGRNGEARAHIAGSRRGKGRVYRALDGRPWCTKYRASLSELGSSTLQTTCVYSESMRLERA